MLRALVTTVSWRPASALATSVVGGATGQADGAARTDALGCGGDAALGLLVL